MRNELYIRTLIVSLQTGDSTSKAELKEHLQASGNVDLFLTTVSDERSSIESKMLAIEIIVESMSSKAVLPWHATAADAVHKFASHENEDIAEAAVKYAKDEKVLEEALSHRSDRVRRLAAKRLRKMLKS